MGLKIYDQIGHTHTQIEITLYIKQAEVTCVAKLPIVTSPVYPHLVLNYDFSYFPLQKSIHSKPNYKNISVVLPSAEIKMWGNWV